MKYTYKSATLPKTIEYDGTDWEEDGEEILNNLKRVMKKAPAAASNALHSVIDSFQDIISEQNVREVREMRRSLADIFSAYSRDQRSPPKMVFIIIGNLFGICDAMEEDLA